MHTGRRTFVSMIVATVAAKEDLFPSPQGMPTLPAPPRVMPQEVPESEGPALSAMSRKEALREQLIENQKKMRGEADHIVELAKALRDEADKTEQTKVLSMALIRKAEEIEKLAHHIKGLAQSV